MSKAPHNWLISGRFIFLSESRLRKKHMLQLVISYLTYPIVDPNLGRFLVNWVLLEDGRMPIGHTNTSGFIASKNPRLQMYSCDHVAWSVAWIFQLSCPLLHRLKLQNMYWINSNAQHQCIHGKIELGEPMDLKCYSTIAWWILQCTQFVNRTGIHNISVWG